MKAVELKTKSVDDLKKLVLESKKQLFKLRIQKTHGELSNTSQFRAVKKQIARVLTVINQKKSGK